MSGVYYISMIKRKPMIRMTWNLAQYSVLDTESKLLILGSNH